MPERWGARAVTDSFHLPFADNPALPKQAPGAASAGSRRPSFLPCAVWETRLEAAPGAGPRLPRQGDLAAQGIGVNREGKSEGVGNCNTKR